MMTRRSFLTFLVVSPVVVPAAFVAATAPISHSARVLSAIGAVKAWSRALWMDLPKDVYWGRLSRGHGNVIRFSPLPRLSGSP